MMHAETLSLAALLSGSIVEDMASAPKPQGAPPPPPPPTPGLGKPETRGGAGGTRTRIRAKQAARAADERALVSGAKSVAQLKRENEVFASMARSARVDLTASRSLG